MKTNMTRFFTVLLILMMVFTFAACGSTTNGDTENGDTENGGDTDVVTGGQLFFFSGSSGGVYEMVSQGLVSYVNQNVEGLELVCTTPSQMTQAPVLMQQGEAHMSIAMADTFERAWAGVEEYAATPATDISQVMGLYDNVNCFVALDSFPYDTVDELAASGAKFTISTTASNSVYITTLLETAGVDVDKNVTFSILSYAQASEALSDGNVDIAQFTGYPKNATVDSLSITQDIKFIGMSDELVEKYDAVDPLRKCVKIPAGTYDFQKEDVMHSCVYTTVYARNDLSEELVYNFIKAIMDNTEGIAKIHPAAKDISVELNARYLETGIMSADRLHPGAYKYWKEAGIL